MLKAGRGAGSPAGKVSRARGPKGESKRASGEVLAGKLVTFVSKEAAMLAQRAERLKGKLPQRNRVKFRKMISEQKRHLDALKEATHQLALEVVKLEPKIGRAEVDRFVRLDIGASLPTIVEIRNTSNSHVTFGQEESALKKADNSKVIHAARRAGRDIKAAILARADMLTAEAAAERVGRTRQSINNQRIAGKIIGLSFGDERFRYPEWQFRDNVYGRPLSEVLRALETEGPWEKWRFFTSENGMLGGRTPADAMTEGGIPLERIVRAAIAFAHE